MLTLRPAILASTLSLAVGAASAAPPPSNMNYAYQVRGDAQALPVQAFDDGKVLYVQLRDTANPPAPVGANGPLPYTLRGPYLVLPIVPRLQLRLGPYSATVAAEGAGDVLPGVVSVRRPVEVSDAVIQAADTAPVGRPYAPQPSVSAVAPEMMGEIVANGPVRSARATATRSESPAAAGRALEFSEAAKGSAYTGMKVVTLRADGTAAGAQAAMAAQRSCKASGATCSIEYRGAPSERIMVVEAGK